MASHISLSPNYLSPKYLSPHRTLFSLPIRRRRPVPIRAYTEPPVSGKWVVHIVAGNNENEFFELLIPGKAAAPVPEEKEKKKINWPKVGEKYMKGLSEDIWGKKLSEDEDEDDQLAHKLRVATTSLWRGSIAGVALFATLFATACFRNRIAYTLKHPNFPTKWRTVDVSVEEKSKAEEAAAMIRKEQYEVMRNILLEVQEEGRKAHLKK